MKNLIALLALASAAAAAPQLKCANGGLPRLTGDLFAPIECSSATLKVAALPVPPAKAQKIDLKALEGVYEGNALQGFGRYELRLELKTGWLGRAEGTLKLIELQFRTLSSHTLKLVPAKGDGRYATYLATDAKPSLELKGEAIFGAVDVSTAAAGAPPPLPGARQADFLFANGASYRVRFSPDGPSDLHAQVWWAVPGAPARSFETQLKRLPPAKR
jgi:hypothetical protein